MHELSDGGSFIFCVVRPDFVTVFRSGTRSFMFYHSKRKKAVILEIAVWWPHLMRDVPALWPQRHTYTLVKGRASSQKCFHPTCFSFLHTFSSRHTFLPIHNFPQVFPSTKLSSINHDSHLRLSGFSPLRNALTVNHYLRNQDFQHVSPSS